MPDWLLVVVGLSMLVLGAESLVRGAVSLALRLNISPTIIGLTVVAVGTSLPELVIGLADTLRGTGGVAVGGILGSNVFNIGAILGASALIYPVRVQSRTLMIEYPIMLGTTLTFAFLAQDGVLRRLDGSILLAITLGFVIFLLYRVKVDGAEKRAAVASATTELKVGFWNHPAIVFAMIVAGCVLLYFGAELGLEGAKGLAKSWGWSDHVIGLTVIAFGTSAPELAVSLVAALRKETEIAVGNIIGSCFFNVALVLGSVAFIRDLALDLRAIEIDVWWVCGFSVLMFPLMWRGRLLGRVDGSLLLLTFALYYILLFNA